MCPLFEYKCGQCEIVFENLSGYNNEMTKDCPSCGGRGHRQISLSNFVLSGDGWAKDNYEKGKGIDKGC